MYTVYAILSEVKLIIYVGLTDNLERRIKEHNAGYSFWTKRYKPWKLIYTEEFKERNWARKREKELKHGKGKEFLKKLVGCSQKAGIV